MGSSIPSVIGWGTIDAIEAGRLSPGREVTIPVDDERTWAVVVRNPHSAAVVVELVASEG
jgi:hypothetical protein